MKYFNSIVVAMLCSGYAGAQAPEIGFAVQFGDTTENTAWSTGVDALGNTYTCGDLTGSMTVGSETITSAGDRDICVVKHDEQGNGIWARGFGWILTDVAYSIAVDASGNSYVAGRWSYQITIDGTTYASNNDSRDACVIKLNADGDLEWFTTFGGTFEDTPNDIELDANGDIFVTGSFSQNFAVGSETFTGSNSEVFLVKLNADGTPLWTRVFSSSLASYGNALAVDGTGHCYVAGFAGGTVVVGSHSFTSTSGGGLFLAKFDGDGVDLWANSVGDSNYSKNAYGLAADADGNTYMAGTFDDEIQIGGFSLVANGTLFADGFIAKFNNAGEAQWADEVGGASSDIAWQAAVDVNGNPYFTGYFRSDISIGTTGLFSEGQSDAFVTALDPDGAYLWAARIGGPGIDFGHGLAIHPNGSCHVAGFFSESMTVGSTDLTSNGNAEGYLVKFGTDLVTGVPTVAASAQRTEIGRFNLLGQPVDAYSPGLRIIRFSNGSAVKVFVRP